MNIEMTRIKPKEAINEILNRNRSFIETVMTNLSPKFSTTFLNCLSDPKGTEFTMPYVTNILFYINEIVRTSNPQNNPEGLTPNMIIRFVNMFIDTEVVPLPPAVYYIPKFNLFHYGNICHLNTCLLMLSSLYHFLKEINDIPAETIPYQIDVLKTILNSSYSPVDINPGAIVALIKILHININAIIPAEETMAQIVSLFDTIIPKSTLLHWNYLHTNITDESDKDSNLDTLVTKYQPRYLLVNGQDFSVEKGVTKNTEFVPIFVVNGLVYRISSIIVHVSGAHFINVFIKGSEDIIKDDLCGRYQRSPITTNQIGRYQITECCYCRVDQ